MKVEKHPREVLTDMDDWVFVQQYRPYRCYLCPDGTSEFAEISCVDPWYRQIKSDEEGHGAIKDGYVTIEKANPEILIAS